MKQYEQGWLVGILEGEGCFYVKPGGRPQVRVVSTTEEVVRRIDILVPGGRIYGPYTLRKHPNRKPTWEWNLYRKQDVARLLRVIGPSISSARRQRLDKALAAALS